jgi:hypothetical protein
MRQLLRAQKSANRTTPMDHTHRARTLHTRASPCLHTTPCPHSPHPRISVLAFALLPSHTAAGVHSHCVCSHVCAASGKASRGLINPDDSRFMCRYYGSHRPRTLYFPLQAVHSLHQHGPHSARRALSSPPRLAQCMPCTLFTTTARTVHALSHCMPCAPHRMPCTLDTVVACARCACCSPFVPRLYWDMLSTLSHQPLVPDDVAGSTGICSRHSLTTPGP